MVRDYLNLNLATVAAPSGDLQGQIFDLIQWAEARGEARRPRFRPRVQPRQHPDSMPSSSAIAGVPTHFAVVTLLVGIPGILGSIVWWTSGRDLTAWAIAGSAWLWVTGLAGIALL